MEFYPVFCFVCGKKFFRDKRQINEAKKFKWKTYCSYECQARRRNKLKYLMCAREGCKKTFIRQKSSVKKVRLSYCSISCAVTVNNCKRAKKTKVCANPKCNKIFVGANKYCSKNCLPVRQSKYTKEFMVNMIQTFVKENDRPPFKQELIRINKPVRKLFGSWNNAIRLAGFNPNPLLFSRKYLAKDGHKCDSLSEKIIDDWLEARKIFHERNVLYPGNFGFTVDFKVGCYWIEFFGLSGQLKRYDELKLKKIRLVKKFNLKLIELYPYQLFPENKLNEALNFLL
jgi:hypothetical protein